MITSAARAMSDTTHIANRPSLISPIQSWVETPVGSPPSAYPAGWQALNGLPSENEIVVGLAPDGVPRALWHCIPSPDSGADGGWNYGGGSVPIDRTKKYRMSCWFKRSGSLSGSYYFGCLSNSVEYLGNGVVDGNPYFNHGSPPVPLDQWWLSVGYVYPAGTKINTNPSGGAYTPSSGLSKLINGNDFRFSPTATELSIRAYQFYTPNPTNGSNQYMFNPRIDLCDGTEPSIAELLYSPTPSSQIIYPTFMNGWDDFDANHMVLSAVMDNGIVTLTGLIRSGTGVICQLPEGFRPKARLVTNQLWDTNIKRVDVDPNGQVIYQQAGSVGWLTLNISYPAAWKVSGERRQ